MKPGSWQILPMWTPVKELFCGALFFQLVGFMGELILLLKLLRN
uniref:Uncharacterized protein n=1 Tax=Rhizophora mucronata TaxID=61149 RepID=A0A2P2QR29_RHIMU